VLRNIAAPEPDAEKCARFSGGIPLYVFVFTHFRTQNRYALLLEML